MLTIIEINAREDGGHGLQSQSHRTECWLEGWITVPEELKDAVWACSGHCDLDIRDGVLVGITPRKDWPAIETLQEVKLSELSEACSAAITSGCDVTVSNDSGHISLTAEDQINLSTATQTVEQGAEGYPYHLDDRLCAVYPAEDIRAMAQAATVHKLYHTTYYNHLAAWVRRCKTAEELEAVTYGAQLPEDLAASMAAILAAAGGDVDAV